MKLPSPENQTQIPLLNSIIILLNVNTYIEQKSKKWIKIIGLTKLYKNNKTLRKSSTKFFIHKR